MSKVLLQDVVDQAVTDTLTETNVFVGTIAGGIWIGDIVAIEQTGKYVNSGSGQSYTIRLYIGSSGGTGGTEVTEFIWGTTSSALASASCQRWELYALDADSLRVVMRAGFGGLGSDDGTQASATIPGGFLTNRVEGLSGLTGDTEIRITVQLSSVTGTTHSFTSRGVWVGLIDDPVTATTYTEAQETDSATSFGAKIGYGLAAETDTAGSFINANVAYTHALETDTARPINVKLGYTFAQETDTGGTFIAAGGSAYALAQETDTARSFGVKVGYGAAIETDTARSIHVKVPYTHAGETDTAGVFVGGGPLPDVAPLTGPVRARVLVGATTAVVTDATGGP